MDEVEQRHRMACTGVYGDVLALGARPSQDGARASRSSTFVAQLLRSCRWSAPSSCREADQGFISLRLNTPVGSSLEYTDGKVREVEAALKQFPEIELAMTTVGTEEGRNYARVNLKLVDRARSAAARRRSSRRAIRDAI